MEQIQELDRILLTAIWGLLDYYGEGPILDDIIDDLREVELRLDAFINPNKNKLVEEEEVYGED
jgi:hypothetical protein